MRTRWLLDKANKGETARKHSHSSTGGECFRIRKEIQPPDAIPRKIILALELDAGAVLLPTSNAGICFKKWKSKETEMNIVVERSL